MGDTVAKERKRGSLTFGDVVRHGESLAGVQGNSPVDWVGALHHHLWGVRQLVWSFNFNTFQLSTHENISKFLFINMNKALIYTRLLYESIISFRDLDNYMSVSYLGLLSSISIS